MENKETLEEFAKRRVNEEKLNTYTPYNIEDAIKEGAKWQSEKTTITLDDAYSEGFENGKNYQTERMYSEEEVFEILLKYQSNYPYANNETGLKKWFKQLKKK